MKFLVLNGPNLNLLGIREPETYGNTSLSELEQQLAEIATSKMVSMDFFQSNSEAELIDKTQSLIGKDYNFMIINPAGYSHTSIAWRDAVLATRLPFIEVHVSNIFKRESFRHKSFFSDIAVGIISGLGINGYKLALQHAIEYINHKE